jgi:release factor glutamine methyltransferase
MDVQTALYQAFQRLKGISETAGLDAQVLMAHILGRSRAWVLAHSEAPITPAEIELFQGALIRLEAGEPLPYVLGCWEFYGLEFQVAPDVLIPRPETELLVDQALDWLTAHPGRRLAADIGTGSGCIAISLAVHCSDLKVIATDLYSPALRIAQLNAIHHHVADRILFVQADLLSPFPYSPNPLLPYFDLLCANLPYIPTDTLRSLDVARSEPWSALHGGADGLDLIHDLVFSAPGRMAFGGVMFLEIESSQGVRALALARRAFHASEVQIHQDLARHDRVLVIQLSSAD